MPNWCSNVVTFSHDDAEQIKRLVGAFNGDGLMKEFIPVPKELQETTAPNNVNEGEMVQKYGYGDWYSFQVNEWGTKWDVSSEEYNRVEYTEGETRVTISFESAWSPPLEFYNKMVAMGFSVDAYYYEPGMAFCGHYESGEDAMFDISGDSAWVKENIPEDINELFDIAGGMEQWEEEDNV